MMSTVSEKLLRVAENVPKVYHAGQLNIIENAECLKGNASGSAILIDDVSPVTHEMSVKVNSKNLIPYPYEETRDTIYGISIAYGEDGSIIFNGTAMGNVYFKVFERIKFPAGKHYLSGTPTDGGSKVAFLYFFETDNPSTTYNAYTTNGVACSLSGTEYSGRIYIANGQTVENLVFKPQLELGTTATAYTPYVSDLTAVKVIRCGKNLTTPQQVYKGASLYSEEVFENKNCVRFTSGSTIKNSPIAFKPNTQYTVSFDVKTVLSSGQTTSGADNVFCFFYEDGTCSPIYNIYTQTDWVHKKLTSTVGKTVVAVGLYTVEYRSYSYVDIGSFQLEEGSTATAYEPYQGQTYTPAVDGTVSGVKSLYPTTTLMTNTEGVIIDCEYYKDIDKTYNKLSAEIALSGGE